MRVIIWFTSASLQNRVVNVSSTQYRNPLVARLKKDHAMLSSDINLLNRELIILKETIRNKQKDLRLINIALINKATRGPFLSVVPSSTVFQTVKLGTKPLKADSDANNLVSV